MKHRIRVSGLLRQGDHILLVEQQNPYTGTRRWMMPGGGLEPDDTDIFAGVMREVFEETGLIVRAGALRFISEHYVTESDTLMVDLSIECFPVEDGAFGEISQDNNRHDDNIVAVDWWSEAALRQGVRCNPKLLTEVFWQGVAAPAGQVAYLGRWA
jgi:8-oxo-dGTP pyrophosphatase MutT (NUDIX family)